MSIYLYANVCFPVYFYIPFSATVHIYCVTSDVDNGFVIICRIIVSVVTVL